MKIMILNDWWKWLYRGFLHRFIFPCFKWEISLIAITRINGTFHLSNQITIWIGVKQKKNKGEKSQTYVTIQSYSDTLVILFLWKCIVCCTIILELYFRNQNMQRTTKKMIMVPESRMIHYVMIYAGFFFLWATPDSLMLSRKKKKYKDFFKVR